MTGMAEASVEILADGEALAERAADWLVKSLRASEGTVAVALSGGNTPRRLYELLAAPPRRTQLPWERLHCFWGDERFVPPDHPDSNYRMAREAMLDHVPVPAAQIHPVPTQGMSPAAAAVAYERDLQRYYGSTRLAPERPLFCVTLLGLGEDGHTASLFPESPVLRERDSWVAAVVGEKPEDRITLTLPALESSRAVAFLVSGASKRATLERIMSGGSDLPAGRLRPQGELRFFVDRAAAPARR